MNRWLRLALQTAFGLLLLWLWIRTVSLPEVLSHARSALRDDIAFVVLRVGSR